MFYDAKLQLDEDVEQSHAVHSPHRARHKRPRLAWLPSLPATHSKYCAKRTATCSMPVASVHAVSKTPSRRAFVYLASTSVASLFHPAGHAETVTETQFSTFTSKTLHASVEYPSTWYRSERADAVAFVDLKTVQAATVSKKPVEIPADGDAFAIAYELVRDRIEKEGADIVLKKATVGKDGVRFEFRAETLMPNGDRIERVGVGRGVAVGEEGLVCIFTAPKKGWGGRREVAERVVESLRIV